MRSISYAEDVSHRFRPPPPIFTNLFLLCTLFGGIYYVCISRAFSLFPYKNVRKRQNSVNFGRWGWDPSAVVRHALHLLELVDPLWPNGRSYCDWAPLGWTSVVDRANMATAPLRRGLSLRSLTVRQNGSKDTSED